MKLTEVKLAHNIYVAQWCDDYGDCLGFVGPTYAAVGEYEVFGELAHDFAPNIGQSFYSEDNAKQHDYGYILVGHNLDDALKGRSLNQIPNFPDDKRNEFGRYIGKHPDIKFYPEGA